MNLTLLFALVILLAAVFTALVLVGVVIYRTRLKRRNPTQELSPEEAAEITSTFNLLNH